MENLSEYYYKQLAKTDTPGAVIAEFYCRLYNIDVTRSETILFNKLVKTFGRFIVFSSVLDTFQSKPDRMENPYAYIFEVCKSRFENTYRDSSIQARVSLERYIGKIDEKIEEFNKIKSKIKIPSSEGL